MKSNDSKIYLYLTRLKGGDKTALALLYDCTHKPLYSLCYTYFKNRADSEDAVVETYVKIQENIASFNGKSGFNWVYTIAKNICLNQLKRNAREVFVDFSDSKNDVASGQERFTDVEEGFEDSDIVRLSKKVLNELEFRIVVLHVVNGERFKAIAKLLSAKESTIRWQYNNALKKLRKKLKEERS